MPKHLTPEQVQRFEQEGYLNGIPIYSGEQLATVRENFDKLEQAEGRKKCEIGLQARHLDLPFVWELAKTPAILDCIEDLMGPDVMLLSTHFFCKYPEFKQSWVAWHQDITYWGLEPPYALTAWYAVDDSDVENGCMRGIPGSHTKGILEHGKSAIAGNLLSINQEAKVGQVDDSKIFDFVLKAGQISIHHGHLVHGSNRNGSDRRRCGLTLRYIRPDSKPVAANSINKPWPAICLRGVDKYKHFGDPEFQFERS
ncbi:MAG: phytanoyl-CoA dioxygenase family protein [Planctomycetota bacterium]|nr:phytanoyl-CoA dioxygenase family protein [Planctomycetota bacterium]